MRDCLIEQPAYHMRLSYRATRIYKFLYATVYNNNSRIQQIFFQRKNSKGLRTHYTASQRQNKKTTLKIRAKTGKVLTGLTHSRLDSPVKSPILLFRINHPCNLGFGVTNLLLTCRQSTFYREWKENRKKILTYPIIDGCSKLDLLPLLFSPKLPEMHLFHLQRVNPSINISCIYIYHRLDEQYIKHIIKYIH